MKNEEINIFVKFQYFEFEWNYYQLTLAIFFIIASNVFHINYKP